MDRNSKWLQSKPLDYEEATHDRVKLEKIERKRDPYFVRDFVAKRRLPAFMSAHVFTSRGQ